jgi:hypothetical protein
MKKCIYAEEEEIKNMCEERCGPAILDRLYKDVCLDHDVYVLYVDPQQKAARETILCGLLDYRELCWRELERGADVIKSYYQFPESDSCWWARGSYLASLDPPSRYPDVQSWIASGAPRCVYVVEKEKCLSKKEYLRSVVFRDRSRSEMIAVERSKIVSVQMGFGDRWFSVPEHVWKDRNRETLHLDAETLRIEDPVPYVRKMIRFRTMAKCHYFLEEETVRLCREEN